MRNNFPFFANNPSAIYLDTAATSQTLSSVIEDTHDFYLNHKSNAHRSGHSMGTWIDEKYQQSKELIGQWLNIANPEDTVIFNSGASQGLNDAVQIIGSKFSSVTAFVGLDFHHSLYLPMQRLGWTIKIIDVDSSGRINLKELNRSLSEDNSEYKVLGISAVSNVLGNINNLDEIKKIAKDFNAFTIIDASQLITKRKVNLKDFDFVAWSWHKIYGPMGLGTLVINDKWIDSIPVRPGGGSVISVSLDEITYQTNAARFESGTQNLAAIATLPRLVSWLIDNQEEIIEHDIFLSNVANELGKDLSIFPSESGLLSLEVKNGAVEDYVMLLDAKQIYVRGGKLCAQPLIDSISDNKGLLRLSWGAYTSEEELVSAFKAIGEISARISRYV